MNELYFLIRYIPFWAIPALIIGAECTYVFWVRKKKKPMTAFAVVALVGLLANIFYWIAGGPEKSVQYVMNFVWYLTR